ncbi:MAG: transporter [Candidatus Eremiobacteraeota bacterium]|nr:transporter [Candidatus Eremiobacteraeota bacterium]
MSLRYFFLFLLMLSTCAMAQEDDGRPEFIIVDRPSFANGSAVVGDGVRSLESGVLITRTKGTSDVLTQTPLLFRAGTSDDLEFRLATSGLNFQSSQVGWADLSPGFKWKFLDEEAATVSLVTSLTVPVGSRAFRNDSLAGSLSLAADFPVSESGGILINLGANGTGTTRADVIQPFFTVGYGHSVSEDSSLYFEAAAFGPDSPGAPSTTAGDIVFAHRINPDLQFDVAAFKGFSSYGLDWALTTGLSTRF